MKLDTRVKSLEASTAGQNLCTVTYKHGKGPDTPERMSLDKALQEARTGRVKRIDFPLTFNEEQAEKLHTKTALARSIADALEGILRDTADPSRGGNLLLCTKPIVFARQAPPAGRVGGQLITEDGTPFHQSQWQEILTKYNAGFIIVRDYDETKEPWYKERSNPK